MMMMMRRRRRRRIAYQPREFNTTQKHTSVLRYITTHQMNTHNYLRLHITRIYSSTCFDHFLWPSSRSHLPRINQYTNNCDWTILRYAWIVTALLVVSICHMVIFVKTYNTPSILPLLTYLPTLHTSAVYTLIYVIQLCTCRQNLFTKYTNFTYITSIGYFLQLCCSLLQAVNQLPTLSKQHKNTLRKCKGKANLCTGLDRTGWGSSVSRQSAQLRW